MWALPNIVQLNADAAAQARKLKRQAQSRRKPECQHYDCHEQATVSHLYYDIFSNDPKGVIHLCDEHYPDSDDDLFTCDGCQRVMVDHYTWERYQVEVGGQTLCLKCAAEDYFGNEENWIDPKRVKSVVLEPLDPRSNGANVPLFSRKTGVLNVARCRHVLGVEQPLPAGIAFAENAEFDSCDGHQISGRSLLDIIHDLDQPFCPALDATYQFAVSIGIYVRSVKVVEVAAREVQQAA